MLAAAFAVLCALWAAWRQDWTYDEPYHLGWSERLWDEGITERVSAERLDSKTPIMIPNVLVRKAAARFTEAPRTLKLAARLPGVLWLLLTLLMVGAWARAAFGESAGAIAVLGAALDPNLIAHASLATVDAAYAFATLATLWTALRFARAPGLKTAGWLGVALGLAFASKFTALLLLPGVALAVVFSGEARQAFRQAPLRWLVSLAVVAGIGWLILCGFFLFREVGVPLGAIGLRSGWLGSIKNAWPELPSPLPASFLTGLDLTLSQDRLREWGVVVLGRRYPHGVWFYFPVVWAVKTPLLLLAALVAGVARTLLAPESRRNDALRFLAANLTLTLGYFCLVFSTQKGLRFVLMCVPLAWLLAAPGLASLPPRRARLLAAAFVLAVAENLLYLGNPLSFTNAAVWPKRQAFRLIADSNIDWGQNRDKIGGWLAARGVPPARLDPLHMLPGPNVFTLNAVAGVFDFEQHRWLREHLDPVEQLGDTYLRFDVENAVFDRFMNEERRLRAGATASGLCGDDLGYAPEAPGTQVPFVRDEEPRPDRAWVACVRSQRGIDLGFRVLEGRVRQGVVTPDGRCDADLLQDDQVSWRRLDPGSFALCAIEVPNRRAYLPYRVDAIWIVRGQAAELNVRPLALDPSGTILTDATR